VTKKISSLLPQLKKAKAHHIDVVGPLSADQLFYEAYSGHYDAVVSMYHDQGLAPFKMVSFYDGVNVTLGLPFVRTSPDHGTAFDIAFQNKADSRSMESAMRLVAEFVQASHKLI
jgi:4-hydroxy-L-threonine phosphate dehydrogenase PdxA